MLGCMVKSILACSVDTEYWSLVEVNLRGFYVIGCSSRDVLLCIHTRVAVLQDGKSDVVALPTRGLP